jgi:hypothetical protein
MAEPSRRLPAAWHVDKIPGGHVVRDANGQAAGQARRAKVLLKRRDPVTAPQPTVGDIARLEVGKRIDWIDGAPHSARRCCSSNSQNACSAGVFEKCGQSLGSSTIRTSALRTMNSVISSFLTSSSRTNDLGRRRRLDQRRRRRPGDDLLRTVALNDQDLQAGLPHLLHLAADAGPLGHGVEHRFERFRCVNLCHRVVAMIAH